VINRLAANVIVQMSIVPHRHARVGMTQKIGHNPQIDAGLN